MVGENIKAKENWWEKERRNKKICVMCEKKEKLVKGRVRSKWINGCVLFRVCEKERQARNLVGLNKLRISSSLIRFYKRWYFQYDARLSYPACSKGVWKEVSNRYITVIIQPPRYENWSVLAYAKDKKYNLTRRYLYKFVTHESDFLNDSRWLNQEKKL